MTQNSKRANTNSVDYINSMSCPDTQAITVFKMYVHAIVINKIQFNLKALMNSQLPFPFTNTVSERQVSEKKKKFYISKHVQYTDVQFGPLQRQTVFLLSNLLDLQAERSGDRIRRFNGPPETRSCGACVRYCSRHSLDVLVQHRWHKNALLRANLYHMKINKYGFAILSQK